MCTHANKQDTENDTYIHAKEKIAHMCKTKKTQARGKRCVRKCAHTHTHSKRHRHTHILKKKDTGAHMQRDRR